MHKTVVVDCARIINENSFHQEFSKAFGFPKFYGRNMNAWIDCMSSLDSNFSEVSVEVGEIVTLQLDNAEVLKKRAPRLLKDILEMSAFVNWRRIEEDELPILIISCDV